MPQGFADHARRLGAKVYQRQVKFIIPADVIGARFRSLPAVPQGYTVRSPQPDEDLTRWANLLNSEGAEFGHWTAERVRRDIVSRLIRPDAATLVTFGDELVACASTDEARWRGKRIGLGMYLYVHPHHRAKRIAQITMHRTTSYFLEGGFEYVVGSTDPSRNAALAVYLAEGYVPMHDSLLSPLQWFLIHRKVRPVVERLRRRAGR